MSNDERDSVEEHRFDDEHEIDNEHGTVTTSDEPSDSRCPVMHAGHQAVGITANQHWWPDSLNLRILRQDHPAADPLGAGFDYKTAFEGLDVDAMTADLDALMTDSQDWWPADYGHYGPFFIRLSWHAAGTYRVLDGRGGGGRGAQRFAPLGSWPDNASLDKARRLLWPIKQKYGQAISWADLLVLAGNRALETMGFKTFGFAFGRPDMWAPEEDVYWGPEDVWLGDERYSGDRELANPLGAVQMGLIYVNPTGPNGNPDPMGSARDVRETFGRMAMNDEETVALIAGGHTFGKMHGAADPDENVGAEPEGAPLEQQGLGWKNAFGTGVGNDTITSGIEGPWTNNPIVWDNGYFDNLLGLEWEVYDGPGGAPQWRPVDESARHSVPSAGDPSKMESPVMNTADIALKTDPIYLEISQRFHQNPDQLADAFARAWYKLLHRDMGPIDRYLGPWVPDEELIWQDPVPEVEGELIDAADVTALKAKVLDAGLTVSQLVSTAWASASTYRNTDMRGGANGARIRLSPQAEWDVNVVSGVARVISALEGIQAEFNSSNVGGKQVSLADLIVLAGNAGVEKAASDAGHDVTVPFHPGRTDATQEQTDVESVAYLEPKWDAFRNYLQKGAPLAAEHLLIDKAFTLGLGAPEMTVLLGGLRVLGANAGGTDLGVLTDRPGQLTNDFFVNLLDMGTEWAPTSDLGDVYEGTARDGGAKRWTATRVDLVFGSNSELRALAEVYAANDGGDRFVSEFVEAWTKVMENDRFDLA